MKIASLITRSIVSIFLITTVFSLLGCSVGKTRKRPKMMGNEPTLPVANLNEQISFDVEPISIAPRTKHRPRTNLSDFPDKFWNLSLDDAIMIALKDTEILRSLGATSVTNPQGASSAYDSAITTSDPNLGIEAALAQFDARLGSSLTFAKNDEVFNNPVLGGNAQEVREDVSLGAFSLAKTTGMGTQFGLNSDVRHTQSDSPGLVFPHLWQTTWEATIRHPLMQGSGVQFNQIVGPVSQPGFQNSSGVLVSRINHEISNAQFERQIREMVREIINAYWRLDLAYKNFQAIKPLRDDSLTTWKMTRTRNETNLPGGEADKEAQAQEQYYQFQGILLSALNGSSLTGQLGVYQAESELRRLLNLPQSDDRLIRPSDSTVAVGTIYDWNELVETAFASRIELQEQKLRVKQRDLEFLAAKNFLLPRLDAVATYRNNGFGDDLAGGGGRFSSAYGDAFSNDHAEWELGFQYDVTIGYRQASAGVRNAELDLCREKAILKDQQDQILHDLGSALRQVDLNFAEIEIGKSRLSAAEKTIDARTVGFEAELVGFDELLEAQRRLLESKLQYFQVLNNFEISKANLLSETGRLLPEFGVNLSECQCQ